MYLHKLVKVSHVIQENIKSIRLFELTESIRQKNDPEYGKILDAFRRPMSATQKVEILEKLNSRVVKSVPTDVIPMPQLECMRGLRQKLRKSLLSMMLLQRRIVLVLLRVSFEYPKSVKVSSLIIDPF